MRAALLVITGLALLSISATAHAQACPDGARGHAFPGPGPQANGYCAPFRCHTDADCGGGGLRCVAVPMCIGQLDGHPGTETAWHQCDADAHDACSTGEHCEHARVCANPPVRVAPTPPPPPPPAHRPPPPSQRGGSKPSEHAPPRR